VRLHFSMTFVTKQILEDPRVHVSEGVLYFDGSPDQLIAVMIQEVVDAVQRKRLEELGKG
jgi:hypothetical protein